MLDQFALFGVIHSHLGCSSRGYYTKPVVASQSVSYFQPVGLSLLPVVSNRSPLLEFHRRSFLLTLASIRLLALRASSLIGSPSSPSLLQFSGPVFILFSLSAFPLDFFFSRSIGSSFDWGCSLLGQGCFERLSPCKCCHSIARCLFCRRIETIFAAILAVRVAICLESSSFSIYSDSREPDFCFAVS